MQKTLPYFLLSLSTAFLNCDSGTSPENPETSTPPYTEVGQQWLYARWEKPYFGERTFTGDTVSVTVIARDAGGVTLFEQPVNADSLSPADTATIRFQVESAHLQLVDAGSSRIFGFLPNHKGTLLLTEIDSNYVSIDPDTSLFLLDDPTGSGQFVGHTDSFDLFSTTYENVIVYYDKTPTFVDGFGHLAVVSPENGVVATIYFGGFSPLEQFGYILIKR